nr:Chain P, INFLUENZA A PEPTIDE [Influenza A virus]1WBZ_Q Chain Q, INFLUENZA A PEPTIDE [Influenza A virus]
SSYRRPVGI